MKQRYFFDTDNSGHWYLVLNEYRYSFIEWVDLDDNDANAQKEPWFATRLNSHVSNQSFTSPKEEF